jgi:TIR domain
MQPGTPTEHRSDVLVLIPEIRMQTGEEFLIFQDRADIAWGQNWRQRIGQALDTVTLLLVIITPGSFRSRHCRVETEQFLDRERELGRDDLIQCHRTAGNNASRDPGIHMPHGGRRTCPTPT